MGGATWKIIEMKKNVFFPTGNDISQLFEVSAKKFKRKGLIVHTLILNIFWGWICEKIKHIRAVDWKTNACKKICRMLSTIIADASKVY